MEPVTTLKEMAEISITKLVLELQSLNDLVGISGRGGKSVHRQLVQLSGVFVVWLKEEVDQR